MVRIMFVCHGNICRSPMGEFVLKDMVKKAGMEDKFYIRSGATSTEEIGCSVYPPAKAELARHGISCSGKTAVQLRADDYDKYDLFLGMDSANIRNMHRMLRSDPEKKIRKLLDFSGGGDVADPWYTGDFETTYRDVCSGCAGLLDYLKAEKII